MNKLPENWGKGNLPKSWGEQSQSSSSVKPQSRTSQNQNVSKKVEPVDTIPQETQSTEEYFRTGDEIKEKLDSAVSSVEGAFSRTSDSVKDNAKRVQKKFAESVQSTKEKAEAKLTSSKACQEKESVKKVPNKESKSEPSEAGKEGFSKKVLIAIIAAVIVIAGIAAAIFIIVQNSNETSENTSSAGTSSAFSELESSEAATSTLSSVNAEDYIGYWHVADSNDQELTMDRIDGNNVTFSLWHYPLTSLDEISANLNGNTADFSYSQDDQSISGTLTFDETSITLTITESNLADLPIGTTVFDNRHDQSWENSQPESQTESETATFSPYTIRIAASYVGIYDGPGYQSNLTGSITDQGVYTIVEEQERSGEGTWGRLQSGAGWINLQEATTPTPSESSTLSETSGETPNVYCPNCGYGFYTTGVGISGFECPSCHYKFNYPPDSHSQEFFNIAGYYEAYDMLMNGEHVDTVRYDGQLTLYSDGTAALYVSGTQLSFNWDVGEMWDASTPSEKIQFEVSGEYLTLHVPDNISWVFRKLY